MIRESNNLIAALVGVLLLFSAAYVFNKYYEPGSGDVNDETIQPVEAEETPTVPQNSYQTFTIGLPLFYEWLEPPVKMHVMDRLDPATTREIRTGQNLIDAIIIKSTAIQENLQRIDEAVDYMCRDATPSKLTQTATGWSLEFEPATGRPFPLPPRPKPSREVSSAVAQDFESMLRRFRASDERSIRDQFQFKRNTWQQKFENSSSATSRLSANQQSIGLVGRYAEGLSAITDHHKKLATELEGLSNSHEQWPAFKNEITPIIAKNIQEQAAETVAVAAGGSVVFENEYPNNVIFVCEMNVRGNQLFVLAGSQANPELGIEWVSGVN